VTPALALGIGELNRRQLADVPEQAWRAEIRDFIADLPADFECVHEDVGYGFGAWSPDLLRRIGEKQWIGLCWPVDAGGTHRPVQELYVLLQELAYARVPAEALLYSLAVSSSLLRFGSPELQRELLPVISRGDATFCEGLTEPDAGSDLLALRTRARLEGEKWVIDGQKIWTSNGWAADYALIIARTEPNALKHQGLSAFIIDLRLPGVSTRPILDMAGQPSFSEIFFDGVQIPSHYLVGQRGDGFNVVLELLEWDRLWARSVKAPFLQRMWEDLVTYSRQTTRCGASLWDIDGLRDQLVDLGVEIEVCDSLFEHALRRMVHEGASAIEEVSMAKVFADRLGERFFHVAQELRGAAGQLSSADVESDLESVHHRIVRGALTAHGVMIAGGTPEVQRAAVATRYFGLARS